MLYHVIKPDGSVVSEDYVGKLEYGTPAWSMLRELVGLKENDLLEHVSVLWKGKAAHMFVDEEGRLHKKSHNPKASRIYYNSTMQATGHLRFIYDDLSKPPGNVEQLSVIFDGYDIVGTAVLWEGDME